MKKLYVLILLLITTQAYAATYYVSPSGNDSNSGTSSSPWKTLQKCATTMNGGDTCIAKDGTYSTAASGYSDRIMNLTSRLNGSAGAYTTFKAENKWGAIINGSSLPQRPSGTSYGVMINSGVSYVRFEDFDWTGMTRAIHDGYGNVSYIYIKGNRFHGINYRQDCNASGGTYTIGGGPIYTKEPAAGFNAHWTVDSNLFYENGRTNGSPNPCSTPPGNVSYNHDHNWYANGNYNTAINNIFIGNHAGWHIVMSNGATYFTIVNNTFVGTNSGREGLIYAEGNNTGSIIENNIFYTSESGGEWVARNDGTDTGSSFKNNLLFNAAGAMGTMTNSSSNDNGPVTTTGWTISGSVTSNPLFTDLSAKNLHLLAGSPAIDTGLATNAPSTDYDGYARPVDGDASGVAQDDIGAFEFGSGSPSGPCDPDVTAPTAPSSPSASAGGVDTCNVSWTASTDGCSLVQYIVSRCTGATCTSMSPVTSTITSVSIVDSGLTYSTTYRYKVQAFDGAANASSYSSIVSCTTDDPPTPTTDDVVVPTVVLDLSTDNCNSYVSAGSQVYPFQFSAGGGAPPVAVGYAYLLADDIDLYFCFSITDTNIMSSGDRDSETIALYDSVELAIDDDGTGATPDWRFTFGANGNYADYLDGSSSWNINHIRRVTSVTGTLNDSETDTKFVIKGAISWAALGVSKPTTSSTTWRIDAKLNRKSTDTFNSLYLCNSDGDSFYNVSGMCSVAFYNILDGIKLGSGGSGALGSADGATLKTGVQ